MSCLNCGNPNHSMEELCKKCKTKHIDWELTRTKPDFIIPGFPRCGTTSLFKYLNSHPDIYIPKNKELNYFGRDLTQRIDKETYLNLFTGKTKLICGDVSPSYIESETAHSEIKEHNPDIKIIIIIRLNRKEAINSLYFKESLLGGRKLNKKQLDKIYDYKKKIDLYKNNFKHVKIILLEDLAARPEIVYIDILDFLGVEDLNYLPEFKQYSKRYEIKSIVKGILKKIKRFILQ